MLTANYMISIIYFIWLICFKRIWLLPVGWRCRLHRLLLRRGVRHPYNECPRYDTKQSDGEVPVMLRLWEMRSTASLPSLPGLLWPGLVAPDKGPIFGSHRTKLWFRVFTVFVFKLRGLMSRFRKTGVQSQVESYQRLNKWYLTLPCLTLSTIR